MASFAEYAFNKAHATAYSIISYQTAYLKCHYPKEYLAALLTSVVDFTRKLSEYLLTLPERKNPDLSAGCQQELFGVCHRR